jgi:hypothetical protein
MEASLLSRCSAVSCAFPSSLPLFFEEEEDEEEEEEEEDDDDDDDEEEEEEEEEVAFCARASVWAGG